MMVWIIVTINVSKVEFGSLLTYAPRESTILGGVNRLAKAFPDAKIRAFVMMKVLSKERGFY